MKGIHPRGSFYSCYVLIIFLGFSRGKPSCRIGSIRGCRPLDASQTQNSFYGDHMGSLLTGYQAVKYHGSCEVYTPIRRHTALLPPTYFKEDRRTPNSCSVTSYSLLSTRTIPGGDLPMRAFAEVLYTWCKHDSPEGRKVVQAAEGRACAARKLWRWPNDRTLFFP